MQQVVQPKAFDNLGLLPKISNINMIRTNNSYISTNFDINVLDRKGKNPWIFNQNVTSLLNLRVIYCFNKDLHNFLLQNNEKIYYNISEDMYKSGIDYIEKEFKLDTTKLNFVKKQNSVGAEFLSSGFVENIKISNIEFDHFSVFICVYLDQAEMSKKLNVNISKLQNRFGTFMCELFIEEGKYINSKLNDVTVFKQKDKFKFNSIFTNDIYSKTIFKNSNRILNYFSELFYSIDHNNIGNFFFILDLDKILKENSTFPMFFDNKNFKDKFYNEIKDYFPYNFKITRKNEQNSHIIYDGNYENTISNSNIVIENLSFKDGKFLVFFKDLSSKQLIGRYKYLIDLSFEDKTIKYLEKIRSRVLDLEKKIFEVYNIANNGNYYVQAVNSFKDTFYKHLYQNKLSIESIVLDLSNILLEFRTFDNNTINSIKNISLSKKINFEILDSLIDIIGYLRTEIIKLENYSTKRINTNIIVSNEFSENVNFRNIGHFYEIMFDENYKTNYPSISNKQYYERIKSEIGKYYNIDDINNISKFKFLTPYKLKGKYNEVIQNYKFSDLDFDIYNHFYVDFLYEKYNKSNFSKLPIEDKIVEILFSNGISISKYKVDNETIRHNKRKDKDLRISTDKVKYDKNILLDILLSVLILQNRRLFNFDFLNPESSVSKVSKVIDSNLPIQTDSVIKSYKNDKITVNTKSTFENYISDKENFFALYSNYKNLYKLQYYDIDKKQWNDITEDILLSKFKFLLCRFINFSNYEYEVERSNVLDLNPVNDVFIMTWDGDVVKNDKDLQIQKQKQTDIVITKEDRISNISKKSDQNIIKPKDLGTNNTKVSPIGKVTSREIQKVTVGTDRTMSTSKISADKTITKQTVIEDRQIISPKEQDRQVTTKNVTDKTVVDEKRQVTKQVEPEKQIITKNIDNKTIITKRETVIVEQEKRSVVTNEIIKPAIREEVVTERVYDKTNNIDRTTVVRTTKDDSIKIEPKQDIAINKTKLNNITKEDVQNILTKGKNGR